MRRDTWRNPFRILLGENAEGLLGTEILNFTKNVPVVSGVGTVKTIYDINNTVIELQVTPKAELVHHGIEVYQTDNSLSKLFQMIRFRWYVRKIMKPLENKMLIQTYHT